MSRTRIRSSGISSNITLGNVVITGTIVNSSNVAFTAGGGSGGGGATGGDGDQIFYENHSAITANYTITSGRNAMTVGPVTVGNAVVITIPDGSRWVIL